MSGYRDLVKHLRGLADIRAILAGMRTLAMIETQRLTRLRDSGQRLRAGLQQAAQDYRAHYPDGISSTGTDVSVVIGSEKGLCGDFNEELLRYVRALPAQPTLVLVGNKLIAAAGDLPQVVARCPGAPAADGVAIVLAELADTLGGLDTARGGRLMVIAHDPELRQVSARQVLPLPTVAAPVTGTPPRLYMTVPEFEAALVEQYLFAALTGALQNALLAENQQRVTHLEAAVRRLDERCALLQQRMRKARQEQIIEEVEVAISISEMASGAVSP